MNERYRPPEEPKSALRRIGQMVQSVLAIFGIYTEGYKKRKQK